MIKNRRIINTLAAIGVAAMLMMPFAGCGAKKNLTAGSTWEVTETTNLSGLTIAEGASITAPKGFSVTMTVDGVETGINPGSYKGDIVLTKTEANVIKFGMVPLIHYFRQALYLDKAGVVEAKSVLSAASSYALNNGTLTGVKITSVGEAFNGIFVHGGSYTIKDATIDFTGNGGNDFCGYGSAIMSTGKDTTLVVDGANINTHGAIRTAMVATGGSNLIVKNSNIRTKNGVLPADYIPNATSGEMKEVPWMLGLAGNCRATNLLGNNTTATYINSSIAAEGWGVLSTDDCQNVKLTAINSKIVITGKSGYGAYAIGNAVDSFYGCDIKVGDYSVIITGGNAVFGASTPQIVAQLNNDLKLGLADGELGSITQTPTTVKSGRFGVMWHGNGSVKVLDDTIFNCEKAIFLIKGASANINVDGSKGVQLNSKNGIIIQMIDNDDPGGVIFNGKMANKGVYTEPTEAPVKAKDFDITAVNSSDVIATFSNIVLDGDFYNAITGPGRDIYKMPASDMPGDGTGRGAPGGASGDTALGGRPGDDIPGEWADSGTPANIGRVGGDKAGGPGGRASGKNMVLAFDKASVNGMISASTARHPKDTITAEDYFLLGEVTNTPCASVNNGVIIFLNGSTWTVTGTSYLTSLTIDKGSTITAPEGYKISMTVNGASKPIKAGTYKGNIVLTVEKV